MIVFLCLAGWLVSVLFASVFCLFLFCCLCGCWFGFVLFACLFCLVGCLCCLLFILRATANLLLCVLRDACGKPWNNRRSRPSSQHPPPWQTRKPATPSLGSDCSRYIRRIVLCRFTNVFCIVGADHSESWLVCLEGRGLYYSWLGLLKTCFKLFKNMCIFSC